MSDRTDRILGQDAAMQLWELGLKARIEDPPRNLSACRKTRQALYEKS